MKVLLVNDFAIGGGAEAVMNDTKNAIAKFAVVDTYVGSEKIISPSGPLSYIFSTKYYKGLKEKLESFKPDVIHIHNLYHLLSPAVLSAIRTYKKANKVKVVFTAHDYHLLCPNSGLNHFYIENGELRRGMISEKERLVDLLKRSYDHRGAKYSILKKVQWVFNYDFLKAYKAIDTIIAPSDFLANMFRKLAFERFPNVRILRNPIYFDYRPYTFDRDKNITELKLVFIGRISPEKGILELVRLLGTLQKRNFQLDIYGSGEDGYLRQINEEIDGFDLKDCIHFKGYLAHSEIKSKLKEYHALILASLLFENSPLSIVEAYYNGCRVIVPNYGGMKEIAELMPFHQTFNPDKADSLESAIDQTIISIQTIHSGENQILENTVVREMINYEVHLKDLYLQTIEK